jgi:hypothetical protein
LLHIADDYKEVVFRVREHLITLLLAARKMFAAVALFCCSDSKSSSVDDNTSNTKSTKSNERVFGLCRYDEQWKGQTYTEGATYFYSSRENTTRIKSINVFVIIS